ncbi:hypothetical protein JI744_18275 [Tabrizicola sp. KVB23]|uniref:Uncharacterized protein n=1 Tax=Fuscibacter oryzae TaxID=2803939 RepID=A0A8J7MY05_9RHOB|nr:hypothetical protein [Fuscibacter oryzae]
MSEGKLVVPAGPAGPWHQLTENEKAWIEMIRVISGGRDPRITLSRVEALTKLLDAGWGGGEES